MNNDIQAIWKSYSVSDRWQCYNHGYRCLVWGMYSIEMKSGSKTYRCGCCVDGYWPNKNDQGVN